MRRTLIASLTLLSLAGCPGEQAAPDRCNDFRDCPNNEVCVDGECTLDSAAPSVVEPAAAEPESVEPENLQPDAIEPEAIEPETPDGGNASNDGGQNPLVPNDGGVIDGGGIVLDGGQPLDGGFGDDGVSAENAFASLELNRVEVNLGESIAIRVTVELDRACLLTFGGTIAPLTPGQSSYAFQPTSDGAVTVDCEGSSESLEIPFLVFSLAVTLQTAPLSANVAPHTLRWSANRSSACTVTDQDGEVLTTGDANGAFTTTFSANSEVTVQCDGARETLISTTVNIGSTQMTVDGELDLSSDELTLRFEVTPQADCELVYGDQPPILFDAVTEVVYPLDDPAEVEGNWRLTCDTGSGAAASDVVTVVAPGEVRYFRLLTSNSGLRLTWGGTGSCTLDDTNVANFGDLNIQGLGAVTYVLTCETSTGSQTRIKRVHFGDVEYLGGERYDGVVGNILTRLGEVNDSDLVVLLGSMTLGMGQGASTPGTINFPFLKEVTGNVEVRTEADALYLGRLETIGGNLRILQSLALEDVRLFDLQAVGGDFKVEGCDLLSEVEAVQLRSVGQTVIVKGNQSVRRLNLRRLAIAGEIRLEENESLDEIDLDLLASADSVRLRDLPALDNVDMDALAQVGDFDMTQADALDRLALPSLLTVDGFSVVNNANLTTLALPALVDAGEFEVQQNPQLPNTEAEQYAPVAVFAVTCPNADPC